MTECKTCGIPGHKLQCPERTDGQLKFATGVDHTALLRECLEHITIFRMLMTYDNPKEIESLIARVSAAI